MRLVHPLNLSWLLLRAMGDDFLSLFCAMVCEKLLFGEKPSFFESIMESRKSKNNSRYLVMRLGHLGDVVLVSGVIRYFSELWQCSFDILTRQEWAPLFYQNPYVDRLIEVDKGSLRGGALWRFVKETAKGYSPDDVFYDVHGVLRSRLLGAFWPGELRRYQKMGVERRLFMLSHGKIGGKVLRRSSVLERYATAFSSEPVPKNSLLPQLFLTDAEKKKAASQLNEVYPGGEGRQVVAIHPFATHLNKTWPEQFWRQLISLLEAQNIPWIVIGAAPEVEALKWSGSRSFVNETSLREVMALLEQAHVLVTGDSGPLHLARGVKTRVVGLFGPTVQEWGFYPTPEEGCVLETTLPCRPCSLHGAKPCPHNGRCLREITPQTVFEAVMAELAKNKLP